MKEFSLEEYLKNPDREVVTRDGSKARIVCTDRAGLNTKPIVALITLPNGDEVIKTFWDNGIETAGSEDKNDLFFAPTKHEGWMNLYKKGFGLVIGDLVYNSEEEAKKIAAGDEDYITTIKVEWEE